MSPRLEVYDKALHAEPAPSVQMALRLRSVVKADLERGAITREAAYDLLEALYDEYAGRGLVDERNAVADVPDCFDGWAPASAKL